MSNELKPYRAYKDSGVESIGEVPEEWGIVKLKYLTSEKLLYGANESANSTSKDLPRFIRITDIDNKGNLRDETFKSLPMKEARNFLLQSGDILFARSGATVGKTYYHTLEEPACFAGYLIRYRHDDEKVNSKYVYYYTQTQAYKDWIRLNLIQATIENVSAEKYSSLLIPLANREHQNKIVEYLDQKTSEIDALIADKEKLITLLEEKRQAVITETVTKGLDPAVQMKDSGVEWIGEIPEHWEVIKLKYLVENKTNKKNTESEMSYLGLEHIESNTESILGHSNSKEVESSSLLFDKNDTLFGKLRPYLKKVTQVDFQGCCSSEFLVLSPKNFLLLPNILPKLLLSNKFIEYVNSSTYGAKMPRASWEFMNNIYIPKIPLKEQEEIVKKLNELSDYTFESICSLEKSVMYLKEYRESLIYEAVTGKIDLREYGEETESLVAERGETYGS